MIEIQGYRLEGGGSCPEQYDVIMRDAWGIDWQMGYIRLRGGWLTADVPDAGETEIFRYCFADEWKGQFDTETERIAWLTAALKSIHNFWGRPGVNTFKPAPIKYNIQDKL